jgi:hypothetical protein
MAMNNAELNFIRAIKEDVIYLILMLKFNRPVQPLELAAVLKVTPVIAYNRFKYLEKIKLVKKDGGENYILTRQAIDFLYCTPYSSRKPVLDFDGDLPHKRSFDSYVLRRALAQEPLHEA